MDFLKGKIQWQKKILKKYFISEPDVTTLGLHCLADAFSYIMGVRIKCQSCACYRAAEVTGEYTLEWSSLSTREREMNLIPGACYDDLQRKLKPSEQGFFLRSMCNNSKFQTKMWH